jgi:hypothetical protein
MDPSFVTGTTLNVNVRDDLRKAGEEMECLKRQNNHLLEDNKRLNEVNQDAPEATKRMYDFGIGKHVAELTVLRSHMKDNASHSDTELKKAEAEKTNIRQRLNDVARDLTTEKRNHNTLKQNKTRNQDGNHNQP